MKIYKIKNGIAIEYDGRFFLLDEEDWNVFINDDDLFDKSVDIIKKKKPEADSRVVLNNLEAPIGSQELWAAGVTYFRSKEGRQEESKKTGGGDFYGRVYEAERPELFFKAAAHRVACPGGTVRIRKDSAWNVPEPELTVLITSSGKIAGYTIGNDMSSRSIEGENPLYLPQAKTYDGCAALGPCIYAAEEPLAGDTRINLEIKRDGSTVFQDGVELKQMKRQLGELASFLYRECSFPCGSFLMTGTGIVPSNDFTLRSGDEIIININPIGTLINTVE